MTFYHLFLTYLDENDEENQLLYRNIASEQELQAIIAPFQTQHTASILDHTIDPSKIIHLRIYRSEGLFQDLQLPDGQSPVERQYDYTMYFFDRDMVDGIQICTDEFLTALPTNEQLPIINSNESQHEEVLDDVLPNLLTLTPPGYDTQREFRSEPISVFSIRDQEFTRKREGLFFVLCNFAYIGNFLLLAMIRWTELPNPMFLSVFSEDTVISLWSIISSVLIFVTLFGSKYILINRGRSSAVLALSYIGILVGMLVINVSFNFQFTSMEDLNTGFLVIAYSSAYILMAGEIVVIAFTLFYDDAASLFGRELLYQELTKMVNPILVVASATMFTGMLVTNLVLSTRYNIFFPIWFGYLFFGIVLWILAIQLNIRKLQWQRSIEYKIQLVAEFPLLPPLTQEQMEEPSQLPALPPL
jgi:hypothetical protein